MSEPKPIGRHQHKRHQARCLAVQALYQWQLHQRPVEALLETVKINSEYPYSQTYLTTLVRGSIERQQEIDAILQPAMSRPLEKCNPVEVAALRLAVYELLDCPQIPAVVVLNEAVEITKSFGASDGYKYVNAVLDKLLSKLRPDG